MDDFERVLPHTQLDVDNTRFKALLKKALSKFPQDVRPLESVTRIQLRRRGNMKGLVGMTTYCCVEVDNISRGRKDGPAQRITFYSELLDRLSNQAGIGVIAHELAHSWLNEHVSPDASKRREKEADELAKKWGYAKYLDALEAETEPL